MARKLRDTTPTSSYADCKSHASEVYAPNAREHADGHDEGVHVHERVLIMAAAAILWDEAMSHLKRHGFNSLRLEAAGMNDREGLPGRAGAQQQGG
ncbi:hypothetical protein NFJ02_24g55420 [Pycnococcus provasolii]